MKILFPFSVIVVTLSFLVTPLHAESREWTQAASGKKIMGEYVGMKDESTVTIKMANGRSFHVPLAGLSAEDNDFVKAQMSGGDDAEKPAAADAKEDAKEDGKPAALPEGEVSLTLSGVHMCCKDCEDAVTEIAVDEEVEIEGDRGDGEITIKAPNGKSMERALSSVLVSGFYGTSDHESLKIEDLKDPGIKTNTLSVRDVHLCCGGCVKAVNKAMKTVEGFDDSTAKEGSPRFVVTGEDLNPFDIMTALRAAGFGGSFQ